MKKPTFWLLDATTLVVAHQNLLEADWQIPEMIAAIKEQGRVVEPIRVRKEDNLVLAGKRRVIAVQQMLRDPTLDPAIRIRITMLDCLVYEGLTNEQCQEVVVCTCGAREPEIQSRHFSELKHEDLFMFPEDKTKIYRKDWNRAQLVLVLKSNWRVEIGGATNVEPARKIIKLELFPEY